VADLTFTAPERALMREDVQEHRAAYAQIRAVPLDNSVPPALRFDPRLPGMEIDLPVRPAAPAVPAAAPPVPADLEELAFAPVTHLAALLRAGHVRSVALTEM
jgi:hypothetical protein